VDAHEVPVQSAHPKLRYCSLSVGDGCQGRLYGRVSSPSDHQEIHTAGPSQQRVTMLLQCIDGSLVVYVYA
jgi:hypothetical protein